MKIPVFYQIEKWIKRTFRHGNKVIIVKDDSSKELKRWQWPFFKGFNIKIKGLRNTIIIHEPYQFSPNKGNISILTNDTKIVFNENSGGWPQINVLYPNQTLIIGKNSTFNKTKIDMVSANMTIEIGDDCMLSDAYIINGDGHALVDKETYETTNIPNKTLKIGNHVWIGHAAMLTKNVNLPDDCMVAMGSVVTKSFEEGSVVIAGNPAKVVKTNTTWNFTPPGHKYWVYKDNKPCEVELPM